MYIFLYTRRQKIKYRAYKLSKVLHVTLAINVIIKNYHILIDFDKMDRLTKNSYLEYDTIFTSSIDRKEREGNIEQTFCIQNMR